MKIPRVAILAEIPTPYRQPIFDRLLEQTDFEFHIFFLSERQKDRSWNIPLPDSHRIHTVPSWQWCFYGKHTLYISREYRSVLSGIVFDAVVVSGYAQPLFLYTLIYARKNQIPYIVWTESHHQKERSKWLVKVKKSILRKIYGESAANIVTGKWAAQYVASYGAVTENIFSVPNSVDALKFRERVRSVREKTEGLHLSWSLKSPVILFVGALTHRKGVDLLLKAVRALVSKEMHLDLVLVGEGPMVPTIKEGDPLLGRVHAVGYVSPERLPFYYSAADIFVLPSRQETYGAVMCEALAAGLPLIASSAVGAGPDCIIEGINGYIFESNRVDLLEERLGRLIQDQTLRERMAKASLEHAANFTHDRSVDNIVRAVETAIRKHA